MKYSGAILSIAVMICLYLLYIEESYALLTGFAVVTIGMNALVEISNCDLESAQKSLIETQRRYIAFLKKDQ